MSLRFATDTRGGDRVVSVEGLTKSYDDRPLLESLDLVLWRGERLGIVGANGSGKSTFLKLLARQIPADGGPVHTRMRRPTIESGDEASDVDSAVTPYTPRGRGEQVRARSAVRV